MILLYIVIGSAFGSFIHAWVVRTYAGQSIFAGRSKCTFTGKTLQWFENIPVVSFLIQKGRSRYAEKKLSWTYLAAEIGFAIGFALLALQANYQFTVELVFDFVVFCLLGFTFFYDIKFREIHDEWSTYPAVILALVIIGFGWQSLGSVVLGMIIGSGFFLLQFMVSKGKWIGGGDVRLGLLMGAVLGYPTIFLALMMAYVGGAVWSLILFAFGKRKLAGETPFGTYLSLATFVCMIWGTQIIDWYLNLLY